MRLSRGLSRRLYLPGLVLSLAVAVPCAGGGDGWASAQTVVAQNAAGARKSPTKRAAQRSKGGAGDSKATSASAEVDRQLDSAAKSIAAGDADAATTVLDRVLSGGGLANKHMARALYLRGVAHRRKGRPAQAIADLTNAIWLKDGLGEADRTAALKERGEVSREVGVAEAFPAAAQPERAAPTASKSLLTAPSAPSPFSATGFPVTASPPRRTPSPRESASNSADSKSASPTTSSWQSATAVERKTDRGPVADRSEAGKSRPIASQPGSSEGLGQFISGLFGGGSSTPPAKSKGQSWSTSTSADGQVRRKRAPEAGSISTSAVAPQSGAAAATGAYRLQITIVRSRVEADAVAARLRKEHGRIIGARKLDVDETVYGNMGTFYRVRLGPYASANEPQTVCGQLRTKGYDCLVVTN